MSGILVPVPGQPPEARAEIDDLSDDQLDRLADLLRPEDGWPIAIALAKRYREIAGNARLREPRPAGDRF